MFVFGSRPECIKLAPVYQCLTGDQSFVVRVCHTGQHQTLIDPMLSYFGINVDYNLHIMNPGKSLLSHTTEAITGLEPILLMEAPDLVIVQGDTLSAFAGALASFLSRIPVAHVEAGLRSRDMSRPFPEEGLRRLVGPLTAMHFAPTSRARENLIRENVPSDHVLVTGNTVVDALMNVLSNEEEVLDPVVGGALKTSTKVIAGEFHRRENWGRNMRSILMGIRDVLCVHKEALLVLSVHPNPEVSSVVSDVLGHQSNALLLQPQPFQRWVNVMKRANVLITDSGGMQEEGTTIGVPVILTRTETERPEAVRSGAVVLAGVRRSEVRSALLTQLSRPTNPRPQLTFGDGKASQRIAHAIRACFGLEAGWPDEFSLPAQSERST